ncbi:RNA polymerase sigma factor [Streptomyces sp. NPDC000878]
MTDLSMPADHRGTPAQQLNDQFAAAYREYRSMVRNTIIGRLSQYGRADVHLAEDLTQNTFLALYRYGDRIQYGNPRLAGLLRVMARQSIGHHYRLLRNQHEKPADTGHWQYSNREMGATAAGYYTPATTGFRTAAIGETGGTR